MLYKEIKDGKGRVAVQRVSDGAFIPLDPMNSDYAAFLEAAKEKGEAAILAPADAPIKVADVNSGWLTAKSNGTADQLAFIAKRLGLE